ncbi:hypothetical protein WBG78_30145, partial [Chryseolinea sp. T2]|uniref:hypothetical protein n=1 Tax=Chryseolinea sp. T2 TaxID=3129255 RepID=UPI003078117B
PASVLVQRNKIHRAKLYLQTVKIPGPHSVQAINSMGFDVHSTNAVYGISDFFNKPTPKKLPSIFSMVSSAGSISSVTSNKFSGHQSFDL